MFLSVFASPEDSLLKSFGRSVCTQVTTQGTGRRTLKKLYIGKLHQDLALHSSNQTKTHYTLHAYQHEILRISRVSVAHNAFKISLEKKPLTNNKETSKLTLYVQCTSFAGHKIFGITAQKISERAQNCYALCMTRVISQGLQLQAQVTLTNLG
jgi:hypothetical protein